MEPKKNIKILKLVETTIPTNCYILDVGEFGTHVVHSERPQTQHRTGRFGPLYTGNIHYNPIRIRYVSSLTDTCIMSLYRLLENSVNHTYNINKHNMTLQQIDSDGNVICQWLLYCCSITEYMEVYENGDNFLEFTLRPDYFVVQF